MLCLRGVLVHENPNLYDKVKFTQFNFNIDNFIFPMMYLKGSVKDGLIFGKWTPPGPSPTNAVLLWPETLKYFSDKAVEIMGGSTFLNNR